MLATLFKHEMKASSRTFIWMYIAFAVVAIVNGFVNPIATGAFDNMDYTSDQTTNFVPQALQVLVSVLYFLSIVAIIVITFITIILRFYRNMLGDEGYLMMTLPVTRVQNVLAKLLSAFVWNICTTVLIGLSFLLFLAGTGHLAEFFRDFGYWWNEAIKAGAPVIQWTVLGILAMVIGTFAGILMLYAAMAIGPNLLKNRLGGSILTYIIIFVAAQIISTIAMVVSTTSAIDRANSYSVYSDPYGLDYADAVTRTVYTTVNTYAGSIILVYGIIAVVCWFLTTYMMKHKLNLA